MKMQSAMSSLRRKNWATFIYAAATGTTSGTPWRHSREGVSIARHLLMARPDDPQAVRDVAASLDDLGCCYVVRGEGGDAATALTSFEESCELRLRLLTENADDGQMAQRVLWTQTRIAQVYNLLGDDLRSYMTWRTVYRSLDGLIVGGAQMSPDFQRMHGDLVAAFGMSDPVTRETSPNIVAEFATLSAVCKAMDAPIGGG